MAAMDHFLSLNNFFTNEIVRGKLWIFWKDQDNFQMMSCIDQTITGWLIKNKQRLLITFIYAKCTYIERQGGAMGRTRMQTAT